MSSVSYSGTSSSTKQTITTAVTFLPTGHADPLPCLFTCSLAQAVAVCEGANVLVHTQIQLSPKVCEPPSSKFQPSVTGCDTTWMAKWLPTHCCYCAAHALHMSHALN